jgi:uncharacterized peroxidase-related enzyme
MRQLAHILLHQPGSLPQGERELIATLVSSRNHTWFCEASHGAVATAHLGDAGLVEQIKRDFHSAQVSPRLKALLTIAAKVQQDGKLVTKGDVDVARNLGATDLEIHDTVLIAAAFCMYNRYVDGLGAWQPPRSGNVRTDGQTTRREGLHHTFTRANRAGGGRVGSRRITPESRL